MPALSKAWADGKVTGLRARGGFTVVMEWKDGKVTDYRIASPKPREVKVRMNGETKTISPFYRLFDQCYNVYWRLSELKKL